MANKGSPRFSMNREDLKKVGKGALIALLGALITYGTETIANIDFGEWTPLAVAVFSVLANIGRKYVADNSQN